MEINNFLYPEQISDRLKEMLNTSLGEREARNISTGDFKMLPEPDKLNEYLPAVIISNTGVDIIEANNEIGIYLEKYLFTIYFLYPYEFDSFKDTPRDMKIIANKIANTFMSYPTLNRLIIQASENEQGGEVVGAAIKKIGYDNAETQMFSLLELPMATATLFMEVDFRTYQYE